MTTDDRSLSGGVPEHFDFDTPVGILFVLRAIRLADISGEDKNTLKDLVFLYNTGAKDEGVKQKLRTALDGLGVTPQTAMVSAPTVPDTVADVVPVESKVTVADSVTRAGFGSGRRAPVFAVPRVDTNVAPVKPSTPVAPETAATPAPVVPATPQVKEPATVTVAPVRKITPVIAQVLPVVAEPTPAPVVERAPDVVSPAESVVAPASPTVDTANILGSDADPQKRAQVRMERIRTIKSTVNDRIGNPVNLVDVDNTLGREYMSALLQAMKLLTDAPETESSAAMNRLETVYTQVMALLDEINTKAQAPEQVVPVVPPVAPVLEPMNVPIMPTAPVASVSPQPRSVEKVAPVIVPVPVSVPVPSPVVSVPTDNANIVLRSKVSDKPDTQQSYSGWDTQAVGDVPVSTPVVGYAETVTPVQSVATMVAVPDQNVVERLSTPPAPALRAVVDPVSPVPQPEPLQSVSEKEPPLRSLSELKTADEVSAIEAMSNNPLYTKDVDAGLEQLLGEWSIFKKSGLFGTGPKGREHPLYVKISGMQVPLILSGRFEGSSQEIKQSITDYMNGWRYEQGIVYENNETLDQYLRRVIRHIIDLQKNKRRS